MRFTFVKRERLAKQIADDVAALCPAGTVGINVEDKDLLSELRKRLAEKGLTNAFGEEEFPEHVRFVVKEGEDFDEDAGRTLFLIPRTLSADLFLPKSAEIRKVYLKKEHAEERDRALAVSGLKTLILFYLAAADTAMTSIADVSGEDAGAFSFLKDALEFIEEPPQKTNYIARLSDLLSEGAKHFKAPFSRLSAIARGADESGFAELVFLAAFLKESAELEFSKLLTVGSGRAEILYFLEEVRAELIFRVFKEDGVKKIARHIRLLLGRYALEDAELDACFATLNAAVNREDGGFLASLKQEGVLQGFVKYPL